MGGDLVRAHGYATRIDCTLLIFFLFSALLSTADHVRLTTIGRRFGVTSFFSGYWFGFSDLGNSKQIRFWKMR